MKTFRTIESFDTEYSADSVEWCPVENFRDYFVCGTYQLSETEQDDETTVRERLGRIYLFQITVNAKLQLIQRLKVAAVLDMKWAHAKCNDKVLLGVVNAKGGLEIYDLVNKEERFLLILKWSIAIRENSDDILALSLDWSTGKYLLQNNISNFELKIAVSDSKGYISVFKVDDGIEKTSEWLGHEFEAWIVGFDYWDINILYTGGDDCKFQRFDIRLGKQPTMISRIHGAGVTSLHSNAKNEHLLVSGSYDQILRTWDTRNFKQTLGEINLNGGIWRLKWEPFDKRYLLAACMYDGFRIIDCQNSDVPDIFATYEEHDSIAYGCDWSMLNVNDIKANETEKEMKDPTLISTCSFYDHKLNISAIELVKE